MAVEDADTLPVDVRVGDGREVHEHGCAGGGKVVPRFEGDGENDGEVTGAAALEGPEEIAVLLCIGSLELTVSGDDVEGERSIRNYAKLV